MQGDGGLQGVQGQQGAQPAPVTGTTGAQGIQGFQGLQGVQGEMGTAATGTQGVAGSPPAASPVQARKTLVFASPIISPLNVGGAGVRLVPAFGNTSAQPAIGTAGTPITPTNNAVVTWFQAPRAGLLARLFAGAYSQEQIGTVSIVYSVFVAPASSMPPAFAATTLDTSLLLFSGSTYMQASNTVATVPVNAGDYIALAVDIVGNSSQGTPQIAGSLNASLLYLFAP